MDEKNKAMIGSGPPRPATENSEPDHDDDVVQLGNKSHVENPAKDEEAGRSKDLSNPIKLKESMREASEKDLPKRWTSMAMPGDDDFDEKNVAIHLMVNEWAGDTSIHGVPHVADFITWHLWKRLMWLVLVCSSGALMVWQIEALISEYSKHTTITDIDTVVPPYLDFPDVTVCNYNSFSQSLNINSSKALSDAAVAEELFQLTQPLSKFIWTTHFNQEEQNVTGVWKPRETHNGICWSYETNETIQRPGLFGGLYVELFMDQDDYYQHDSHNNTHNGVDSAGALFFVEEKGYPVNGERPFFTASPGHRTLASVSKTHTKRVTQQPWSQCRNEDGYSQSRCRVQCLNKAERKACSCKNFGDLEGPPHFPYCHSKESEDCINNFFRTQKAVVLSQCTECFLPPCEETNYNFQVSVLDFSRRLVRDYVHRLEKLLGYNITTNPENEAELLDLIDDNLVIVQINFDRLQSLSYTEQKAMSLATLLGGIGGSMGLFLGISVISVYEFFGDLIGMRLLPRLFGHRSLHGLGAR